MQKFQLLPPFSSLTKRTTRTCRHQISMQTHPQAAGGPNASTRQLLEARASSMAPRQQADDGMEDEDSDGGGDASPSQSNARNSNDVDCRRVVPFEDGKRTRMSQDGTAPPRENGEQASPELTGRKARVSVRARSEAPMVIITRLNNEH